MKKQKSVTPFVSTIFGLVGIAMMIISYYTGSLLIATLGLFIIIPVLAAIGFHLNEYFKNKNTDTTDMQL